jgi:hypothetical protein
MIFPSFGDAEGYALLGRACADAVVGPAAAFESCYHPVRPIGASALVTLPYLLTGDPVDAAYVALALNLAFFAMIVACMTAAFLGDGTLLAGRRHRTAIVGALTFLVFLVNLVSVIPVRLADVPSLAPFVAALLVAVRIASGVWTGRALFRRYGLAGLLCSVAVLLNVRYFVYAFLLLLALLVLDANARRSRARCAAAFVIGMAPVALQLVNVAAHTGQVGLYDREFMSTKFPPRPLGIEAEFATLPEPNAYMVNAARPIPYPDVVALRLFRGLTGFEWSVYHGRPSRGPLLDAGVAQRSLAWAVVAAYLAFTARMIRRGPASLRILGLTAALVAVVTALLAHTELRYYALPRPVLWLAILLTTWSAFPRRGAGWSSAPPTA